VCKYLLPETAGNLTTCNGREIVGIDLGTVGQITVVNICVTLEYTLVTHTQFFCVFIPCALYSICTFKF
jgi:hypothetical protein